jgi:hypothetical protein
MTARSVATAKLVHSYYGSFGAALAGAGVSGSESSSPGAPQIA